MSVSTSAHASTWREEKHEHAKDVARALRARCLERNIDSIFELDEFADDELFSTLGESLLRASGRVPAKSFKHTAHFRNIVRHEFDAMYGDVREMKSDSEEFASPRKSPPTRTLRTSPRRRREDTPTVFERWTARLRVFEDVITFVALLVVCFVAGILFCDVCDNHFQELTKPAPREDDASLFATP